MVAGIESFREKFRDFSDCYTVIGGAACDILMEEADLDFRATKDIDLILILKINRKNLCGYFGNILKKASTDVAGGTARMCISTVLQNQQRVILCKLSCFGSGISDTV